MTATKRIALMEEAKHHGALVGCASARARGLDDWDSRALDAAKTAERLYMHRHANDSEEVAP